MERRLLFKLFSLYFHIFIYKQNWSFDHITWPVQSELYLQPLFNKEIPTSLIFINVINRLNWLMCRNKHWLVWQLHNYLPLSVNKSVQTLLFLTSFLQQNRRNLHIVYIQESK